MTTRKAPPKVFPMFLKLEGRRCLVVGAGAIAEGKIGGLIADDAQIRVIAPEATNQVQTWAGEGKIDWERRRFQPSDLEGIFLVVAATSSTAVHEEIYAEAKKRGVLCNIVDVPHLCDFFYPAIVRRGSLQIAISTAGESPALSQRLRKELEQQFGPEYEAWVSAIGEARAELATRNLSPEDRKEILHKLASHEFFERYRDGLHRRMLGQDGSSEKKDIET
ncbi:MAG TPA: bifunctional precorrin-2 dehydrogenase/sirohydrochlorin ferrochelatase [Candidatus Acidoferrum sp.]|jgi:precorrin-2 dehydrogenase/sirohydrochlorin ferrochelatase|nr:bifunctional precorrin-2 dehydrogenase/sirohydrochlorin ferrochelatase [Candidatus Acidoferrum sp.]